MVAVADDMVADDMVADDMVADDMVADDMVADGVVADEIVIIAGSSTAKGNTTVDSVKTTDIGTCGGRLCCRHCSICRMSRKATVEFVASHCIHMKQGSISIWVSAMNVV